MAQVNGHLVVAVADKALLAPDGLPYSVARGTRDAVYTEACGERLLCSLQAQGRRQQHGLAIAADGIDRLAIIAKGEHHLHLTVRRGEHRLFGRLAGAEQQRQSDIDEVFHKWLVVSG